MLILFLVANFFLPFGRSLTSENVHDNNSDTVDIERLTVPKNPLSAPSFFGKEDDIERFIFSMNRSIYVLQVSEGTVLSQANGSHIVLRAKNGESLIVDIENGQIVEVSPNGNIDNITNKITIGGTDLHTVLNSTVQIVSGGDFPIQVIRKTANNCTITVEVKQGSTVLERRHSDEIKVLMKQLNHSNGTVQPEPLWEHLLIRPQTLHFSAANSHGTLFFEDQKVLQVNSTRDGAISGSPYAHKFGRIVNGKQSIQIVFNDTFGSGRRIDEVGNEIFWNLTTRVGIVKSPNGALTLTDAQVVEDEIGKIRVNLANETVDMGEAAKNTNGQNTCGDWQQWDTPTASVRRGKSCKNNVNCEVSSMAGTFTYEPTEKVYSFVSLAGDKATLYDQWKMLSFRGPKLYAVSGKKYMMLYANGIRESGGVEMKSAYFKVHGAPASVIIYKDRAEVETQSSKIVITPYTFN